MSRDHIDGSKPTSSLASLPPLTPNHYTRLQIRQYSRQNGRRLRTRTVRLLIPPHPIRGTDSDTDRQNNALLNSLSSKVSNLKSVTIDIHDNARDQDSLDHSVRLLPIPSSYLILPILPILPILSYPVLSYAMLSYPILLTNPIRYNMTERSILLLLNEPQRKRRSINPHGASRRYRGSVESGRDYCCRGDCCLGCFGMDFLICPPYLNIYLGWVDDGWIRGSVRG